MMTSLIRMAARLLSLLGTAMGMLAFPLAIGATCLLAYTALPSLNLLELPSPESSQPGMLKNLGWLILAGSAAVVTWHAFRTVLAAGTQDRAPSRD
jgi:hypothetical protein